MRVVPALSFLAVALVFAPAAQVLSQPIPACRGTVQVTLGANGTVTLDPAQVDDGSSDGSGRPVSLSVSPNTFDCASIGSNPHAVTLSVTSSMQTATCMSSVTVVAPPPVVTCQNISVNLDGSGIVTVLPNDPLVSASRVCGGAMQVSLSSTSFTCADVGANATTLTVTIGGESAQCTPTVTVVDSGSSTPPVITCGATVTLPPSDEALLPATLTAPTAVDNCFVAMVGSDAPAAGFPLGDTLVTWTATDPSGNQSSCVQTVRRDCCAPDMGVVDMDMGVVDTDMGTGASDMGAADADTSDTGMPTSDAATVDDMGSAATDMGNGDGGGDAETPNPDQATGADQGARVDAGSTRSSGSSCTAGPSGSGASVAFIGVCALALAGRRRRVR
ncbi:MAG: HYR domain-containing protein [Sandaracinaceae bacterium]|nr:HYR domain-containing protein [Myxococcales bacterium]MCB9657230.1 HYR domain-containing protein [Sandaracinaceae bacterium]